MKARNKNNKRAMSLFISVVMVFSLLSIVLPAETASAEILKPADTIFSTLFTDEEDHNDPNIIKNLPHRDNTAFLSVRELYVGGANMEKPFTFGDGGKLGVTPTYNNGYRLSTQPSFSPFRLPTSLSLGGVSLTSLSLDRVIETYEGDFDGDGTKNELAVICATNAKKGSADYSHLILFVGSAESNLQVLMPVGILAEIQGKDKYTYGGETYTYTDVLCADVNGDGVDEIVAVPYGKTQLNTYYLPAGSKGTGRWALAGQWQAPVVTAFGTPVYLDGLSDVTVSDLNMGNPGIAFSMAADDIDRDGCEDIVYIASGLFQHLHAGAFRSPYILYGTRFADTPQYTQQLLKLGAQEGKGNKDVTGNRAFGRFGLTICDMENDGNPDILLAYMEVVDIGFNGLDTDFVSKYYNVSRLNYTSRSTDFAWELVYTSGKAGYSGDGSQSNISVTEKTRTVALQIEKLDHDYGWHEHEEIKDLSPQTWGSIIVNGEITAFATTYDPETEEKSYNPKKSAYVLPNSSFAESIDLKLEVYRIRRTTITGDGDGFMIHWRKGETQYLDYYDSSTVIPRTDEGVSTLQNYLKIESPSREQAVKKWMYFAFSDVDKDSIFIQYRSHTFFWSDPIIVAALAAPPYFSALNDKSYLNSTTSFGLERVHEEGSFEATSNSAGAYISAEIKAGAKHVKAVVETEIEYNHSWTTETSKKVIKKFTNGFSIGPTGNQVILATQAYDVYTYEMFTPNDDDPNGLADYSSSGYNAVVPRDTDMPHRIISYDSYRLLRANDTKGVLPDLSQVFSHTLGKPETYPSGVPNGSFVLEDSTAVTKSSYVGSNNAAATYGFGISEETTKNTSQTNAVSARLGAGIDVETDFFDMRVTAGVTGGHSKEKGNIVSDTKGVYCGANVYGQSPVDFSSEFKCSLLYYTYTNNPNDDPDIVTRQFPVVTYIIDNVKLEGGVEPSEVTVRDQSPNPVETVPDTDPDGKETVQYTVKAPGISSETSLILQTDEPGIELVSENISSEEERITISIDSSVEAGQYPLVLNVGGIDSNTFYLNVVDGQYTVTIKDSAGTILRETKHYPGERVELDAAIWKGDHRYFLWEYNPIDFPQGIVNTNVLLSFQMPARNVSLTANWHDYAEEIKRIKAVRPDVDKNASQDSSDHITVQPDITTISRDNTATQWNDTVLLWADFGNGLDGIHYQSVDISPAYHPAVTWTIEDVDEGVIADLVSRNIPIEDSPTALLHIADASKEGSVTVRATSTSDPTQTRTYTLQFKISELGFEIVPELIDFGTQRVYSLPDSLQQSFDIINHSSEEKYFRFESSGDMGAFNMPQDFEMGLFFEGGSTNTFDIKPSAFLPPREYRAVYKYHGGKGPTLTLLYTVVPEAPAALSIEPRQKEFDSVKLGYDLTEPGEQEFIIRNIETIGLGTVTGMQASLDSDNFVIEHDPFPESFAPGDEHSLLIRPKEGLPEGIYTDKVTVTSEKGETLTASLYFEVGLDDTTPPTGEISIGTNQWDKFWHTNTYEYFANTTRTVEITAADDTGGPVTIEYYLSPDELTAETVETVVDWRPYPAGGLKISPPNKFFIYAKLTDKTGNAAYINTAGIVLYAKSECDNPILPFTRFGAEDVTFYIKNLYYHGSIRVTDVTNGNKILEPGKEYVINSANLLLTNNYIRSLTVGEHKYTVQYDPMGVPYPNDALEGSDPPELINLTVNVNKADTSTDLVISPKRGGEPGEVTLIAAVTNPAMWPAPTGTAEFYSGNTLLESKNIEAWSGVGEARLEVTLSEGTHNLRAVYLGDTDHLESTSASEEYTVTAGSSYAISASALTPFGSLTTPYTQPAAQTVTVTNTGSGAVTLTQPTATNYDIGTLSATALSPDQTATFTVCPKAGLDVGAYYETITISGSDGASTALIAIFAVTAAPAYTISASALTPFGSLTTPYTQPAARTVTVTNTGSGAVTLTQPTATNYDIGALSATALSPDQTATFTVCPKAGLDVGAYYETITISGSDGASATISASFAVTDAPAYAISASALTPFGSLATPYTQPTAQTVTVTNTGSGAVTLTQPTATNYDIGALSDTALSPDQTATFTVCPKAGLDVGDYDETITISGSDGASATVSASFVVTAAPAYIVTVNNGTGDGSYKAGATVIISADTAPAGQEFDRWTTEDGVTFADENAASTTFAMLAKNITVTATYKALPANEYAINVQNDGNGTANASATSAAAGTEINLTATPNSGYRFKGWQVITGGVTITGSKFTMPSNAVTVKAIFEEIPGTPSYKIIAGANQSWKKGTATGVTITCNGDRAKFSGFKIDGVLLDTSHYDTEGSDDTIVTLKAAYLETLALGVYTVEFVYSDGSAQTGLTILPADTDNSKGIPDTGKNRNILLWLLLGSVSLSIMGGMSIIWQKKKRYR